MDTFIFTKTGECRHCKTESTADLHKQLMQNGAESFIWICQVCKSRNPFNGDFFISKEKIKLRLTDDQIDRLPVIMPELYTRCAVCGARGTEQHHWAPQAIFGEIAGNWPKDFPCKQCHDLWHQKVTPSLVNPKD